MPDLTEFFKDFDDVLRRDVAVAVSGGPDSMALCRSLLDYLDIHKRNTTVHLFTVNHNLRDEAQAEAEMVGRAFADFSQARHHILQWDHCGDVDSRLQERARNARYDLISKAMSEHGLAHLFLGHHQDDQVETFLFRLAKGSGLDGLACMVPRQKRGDITLCRPFLDIPKSACVDFCDDHKIPYAQDRSNDDPSYARVRLRHSFSVLEEEGFDGKRLSRLTRRMARATEALDVVSNKVYHEYIIFNDVSCIVFNFKALKNNPEEVFFRVLKKAVYTLAGREGYGLRMERFERLCEHFYTTDPPQKQTMGGVIFSVSDDRAEIIIEKEVR